MRVTKAMSIVTAGALAFAMLAACSDDDNSGSTDAAGKKIALLLPETQTTRYEQFDKPYFEQRVASTCGAEVIYSNANQDASKQQADAESAIAAGANVIVLDPVDGAQAGAIVTQAQGKNIPVVSYDRLITGNPDVDLYISFDNEKVGVLQGTALVEKLTADGAKGGIVMINGSPTDNNAKLFRAGAHSVIDPSAFDVLKETDTKDWKPENAQADMEGNIAALGKDGFVGVYAANDGTAGGAIAAMKSAGISPLPPVTGQDAELAAIQRILIDEQFMTVYKALKPEAEAAADAACRLAVGETPEATSDPVNNGSVDVKAILLDPVVVTKDNINDTVVKDGFYTVAQICTADYKAACTEAGIE